MGRALAFVLWHGHTSSRQVTETNIRACFPDLSPSEQEQLARKSFQHSVQTALEAGAIWCWSYEKRQTLVTKVTGQEILQQANIEGEGFIVLTPHMGNWEVAGDFIAGVGDLTAMYAPSKLEKLDRFIYEGRSRGGFALVPADRTGVKKVMKALKDKKMVGILPDQVPEMEGGVFAPFFAETALTMTLVGSLAEKAQVKVICVYAKRLGDSEGFEICFSAMDQAIGDKDKGVAARALNAGLENCVKKCPEQYLWSYKRFRKRPPGVAKLY